MSHLTNKVPKVENICAVVVTYNPDLNLRERIEKIRPQVKKLLIVDNASSSTCLEMIQKISNDLDVNVIKNKSNLGIAEALNQGFKYFKSQYENCFWVLTLDQDSECDSNLVSQLISAYVNCPYRDEVGVIGTNYQEKTTGRILHLRNTNSEHWEEVEHLPSSGCITSIAAFNNVGGFLSDLFIDYVDTEFCMRLRKKGFRILISPKIGMTHPLGYYRQSSLYKFITGNSMITNYPPVRHYYWTRNGFRLIMKNFFNETFWSLNELYYIFIKRSLIVLLFEDKKLTKFYNMLLGCFHAVIGIKGIKN